MNTSIMQHASFSELCKILDHEEDAVKKLIHNIFKTGLLFLPGLSIAFDSVFEALDSGLVLIDSISTVESISAEIKNVFGKKNTYEIRSQEAMTVHILMVYAAFFDTLRDYLPDEHKQIKLTNKEKATITQKSLDAYFERTKEQSTTPSSGINRIYEKALPLPYPIDGEGGSMKDLLNYYVDLNYYFKKFINGLEFTDRLNETQKCQLEDRLDSIPTLAVKAYQSQYFALATMYPEFFVYSNQQEHALLIDKINKGFHNISSQLREFREENVNDTLNWLLDDYKKEIEERIFQDHDNIGLTSQLIYPKKKDIFIPQRFYALRYTRGTKLEPKEAWNNCTLRTDICSFISSTLCHNEAGKTPLIVLGHPGAGKSLLCHMLAAQALNKQFHPIIIRLRKVTAGTSIESQINEQLDDQLHNRCLWIDIMKAKPQKPILIFFDGYDELLQASGNYYADYINKISEFQKVQQSRHNIVVRCILTSRLNLIDKANIPANSTVISLADFEPDQIDAWCKEWNECNKAYFLRNPSLSEFHVLDTSKYYRLAVQPLLLSMLALYDSDGNALIHDEELTGTELYNNLICRFIKREQEKNKDQWDILNDVDKDITINLEIQKLSIAAMGMFNRETLCLRASQIDSDLRYFGIDELNNGDIVLGKFLFGHYTKCKVEILDQTYERYAYEFMHDTFCEFLIARHIAYLLQHLDASNPSIEWYSSLIYAPLFTRMEIVNMIEEWSKIKISNSTVINALNELIDGELNRLITGEMSSKVWSVVNDCHLPRHSNSSHISIYLANIFHLRLILGKNYTLKQLEIDLSEKNDEKEYPLKKQKIDIWEHLTNLWRSNFTIEEYEQFSSNFSVMRTYDSCRITYKKDTIDTDEGLIGQIYHSAKLMDDRFILSLSGSLVGDQNPRVLESITQLNINVKSQYWFNVFLWKMQNRDKYNQDTREALKSFREACLKEKQHQYLCTYYMIFQKILENNGIIYLHNSNSRKTAKNIVEDQQFLKDGYIEGHSSKDFVQFSRNICFDTIRYIDTKDHASTAYLHGLFSQMNDLSDHLGFYYLLKFYIHIFDSISPNSKEIAKFLNHDQCKGITDKLSYILKNEQIKNDSGKRIVHELPHFIYVLCRLKEFTYALRLLQDYNSTILDPKNSTAFVLSLEDGSYLIQSLYLMYSGHSDLKNFGRIINRLMGRINIINMYEFMPQTLYWICKMITLLNNENEELLRDILSIIRDEKKHMISLELDNQIKSILGEKTQKRRDKKNK